MVTLRYGKYRFLLLIQSNTFIKVWQIHVGKRLCRVTRVLYEIQVPFVNSKVGLDPNISKRFLISFVSSVDLFFSGLGYTSDLFEIRDIPKESQRVV